MNDLKEFWEPGYLIADQNQDGVPDHINVNLQLPEEFTPSGLIDFCARLGFETTALTFDFLNGNEQAEYQMDFVQDEKVTALKLHQTSRRLSVHYRSEQEVSRFLQFLACEWPVADMDKKPVETIYFSEEEWWVEQGEKTPVSFPKCDEDPQYKKSAVKSLTELWEYDAFISDSTPNPTHKQSLSIHVDKGISQEIFLDICYGAARIGMSSTALQLPMTNVGEADVFLQIETQNKGQCEIKLEGERIKVQGKGLALRHAVRYLLHDKHWREGGNVSFWERPDLDPTQEEYVVSSLEWEGERETVVCLDLIRTHHSNEADEITIFLSEPLSERKKIRNKVQKMTGVEKVNVYSSFKPIVCIVMEDWIEGLRKVASEIGHIKFVCKEEMNADGCELPIRWIQELYPLDEWLGEELSLHKDVVTFELNDEQDSQVIMEVYDKSGCVILEETILVPIDSMNYVDGKKRVYPVSNEVRWMVGGEVCKQKAFSTDRQNFYQFYQSHVLDSFLANLKMNEGQPLFDRIEIDVEMSEPEEKLPVEHERISSLEALHEDLYFNTLHFFDIHSKNQHSPGGVYPFMKVREGSKPKAYIKIYQREHAGFKEGAVIGLTFSSNHTYPTEIMKDIDGVFKSEKTSSPPPSSIKVGEHVLNSKSASFRWIPEQSYKGRWIPVYEWFTKTNESYLSRKKLSVYKPTVLIEAGHHANEVSSRPSVIELMDELSEKKRIDHLNIVVIPNANPDGDCIHKEMTKENPEWKHHAARYNAVGLEYAEHRYQSTPFGEARVVTDIMHRWAPDIVIDNHGIPAHEWIQPFAGYNSPPRFKKSYWLPNALIYGIARKLQGSRYEKQRDLLEQIQNHMMEKVQGTILEEKNKEWMDRYKKYGHQWLPDVFPVEQTGSLLFFTWETHPDPESHVAISRFPDWVSADLISEAADETVYGNDLKLCIEAQKVFNTSILEVISHKQSTSNYQEGGYHIIERKRPLIMKGETINEETLTHRI
ncbi:M14 family zinc carboxypeptidase [Halobacillus seohaensis]|uniref:M14 family zinc carboxypeptidase n=1 Tax=Halobacillus seohaensis TaxID=447421 RepID=A0ABW2EFG4_9BACI